MKPLSTLTGGANIGGGPLEWPLNVTWPFAKLSATTDSIELKISYYRDFTFPKDSLIKVSRYILFPFFGWGVKIEHDVKDYPKKVIFWYLGFPSTVLKYLKDNGFDSTKIQS
jgi:hypothetical protein